MQGQAVNLVSSDYFVWLLSGLVRQFPGYFNRSFGYSMFTENIKFYCLICTPYIRWVVY